MAKKRKPTNKKRTQLKEQEEKQKREQMYIALAAIAVAIIAFLVFGLNPAENTVNSTSAGLPPEINTQTAKQMFDDGAYMLDVRNPDEWETYHVDGSTLLPLPELEGRVNEVPRDQEIIVICNSGNRSRVARDILLDAGFTNVTSIAGGIQGWMSAGYDFVRGN